MRTLAVLALVACSHSSPPPAAPAPAPAPAPTTAAAPAPTPTAAPAPDLPDMVDRQMISDAIGKVKPQLTACGDKAPKIKGEVKVEVKVNGEGKITNVDVAKTPDEKLGACVAGVVQTATFPQTKNGGSFGYPFVY